MEKHFASILKRRIGMLFIMLLFGITVFAQQASTYKEAIAVADQLFEEKKYFDAKSYYQLALKYKSGDEYANKQIEEVVEALKGRMAAEDEYLEVIDLADMLWEESAFDKALEQYKKALEILPDDEYARERVEEINRIKVEEKERMNGFVLAMEQGNQLLTGYKYDEAIAQFEIARSLYPDRSAPSDKIDLAMQLKAENASKLEIFDNEMEEAGRYLLIKNYVVALEHYEKARTLFPDNPEVNDRIDSIREQAQNQLAYNEKVAVADELYISKDYLAAKAAYREAGKVWPENSYPGDMISRIDDQLAEQMKNLEENYRKAVLGADSLLAVKEYEGARAGYNLALTLKPDESYPRIKLREIEDHFAEQKKAFEANYALMINKADSLLNAGNLDAAESEYRFALTIKPEDQYPVNKLSEIETLRKEQEELARLNATYEDLIAEADNLFNLGHYDLAIKKYTEAQQVKSMETYPGAQITVIRQLLIDAEKQKELDEKYGNLMIIGTRLMQEDKLDEARKSFTNALELKPLESLPREQIDYIDSTLEAQAQLREGDSLMEVLQYDAAILAYEAAESTKPDDPVAPEKLLNARTVKRNYERAMARDAKYNEAIKNGDTYFAEESFELAQSEYQLALETKPEENYPKQQLAEIDIILKKLEAEKEQRYRDAIVKADNFFEQSNYRDAVIQYKTAKSIKPEESYPQRRIEECNTLLAEELRRIKTQYDLAIADADKLYASRIYDKAIQAYQEAHAIKPDETYPSEMIAKITSFIEENAIVDVMREVMTINSGVTQEFEFEPVRINVRKSNYVLVKARNLSGNEFKIIFTYGSKNGKNGGFVVQVPPEEGYNDFIIRVGNQYKWFAEDNNWLSVYPENGDIEIRMIRISAGD
ncbi:MAG: tetratricopeptide repeat protein [bacterium]